MAQRIPDRGLRLPVGRKLRPVCGDWLFILGTQVEVNSKGTVTGSKLRKLILFGEYLRDLVILIDFFVSSVQLL